MSASMRIWNMAAGLLMIATVALGWFLGISPKLAEAARFDAERLSVQAQNDIARVQIAQFEQEAERLDELKESLEDLRAAFPTQVEYDVVLEDLFSLVNSQGLGLASVSVAEPTPTIPTALGPNEVLPEPPVTDDGAIPAGTLLVVRATLSVQGSLSGVLSFVDALQRADRFAVVPLWSFTAGEDGGNGSASVTVNIYVVTSDDLPGVEVRPSTPEPAPRPETSPEPDVPSSNPTGEPQPQPMEPTVTPSPAP